MIPFKQTPHCRVKLRLLWCASGSAQKNGADKSILEPAVDEFVKPHTRRSEIDLLREKCPLPMDRIGRRARPSPSAETPGTPFSVLAYGVGGIVPVHAGSHAGYWRRRISVFQPIL